MARRKVIFVPNHYYHIYNRGANRQLIFHNQDNYILLLRRVKEQANNRQISVIAYCLMPNHYHFLLRQDGEESISQFMQAIFNSYTKAFNVAFNRSGTLFEGPFRAIVVDKDKYLIHLCRYIHRNPVDAGLVSHPSQWPYSNYLEWVGKRQGKLVDQDFVDFNSGGPSEYERFVMEYTPPKAIDTAVKILALE